jgi:hypothetical protein
VKLVAQYDLPLPTTHVTTFQLAMPALAQPLDAQLVGAVPALFALVDPEMPLEQVSFCWVGAGYTLTDVVQAHVGTIQYERGHGHAFHLFRVAGE